MAIKSISSVVTSSFIERFATLSNASKGSSFGGSSSSGISASISGLRTGAQIFGNAIAGLNDAIAIIGFGRDDLNKLRDITDEMISLAESATRSGIGSAQRSGYDSQFQSLITKFVNVIRDSGNRNYDVMDKGELEGIFETLGFEKGESRTFAELMTKFLPTLASDGSEVYVSDLSQGERPANIPVSAYQVQVTTIGTDGSGSFGVNYTTSSPGPYNLTDVELVDINGDSKVDMLALADTDQVVVRLGNGDGTFQQAVTYQTGINSPGALDFEVVDLDADGSKDIIISADDVVSGNSYVSILYGNANGSFEASLTLGAITAGTLSGIAAGDVSGDGEGDIIYTNSTGQIEVILGTGGRTFAGPAIYSADLQADAVRLGDIDGDGDQDIVASSGDYVSVLQGNGDGTFLAPVTYQVSTAGDFEIDNFVLTDLDSDGDRDIVVSDRVNGKVNVLLNAGAGTYGAAVSYSVGGTPLGASAGDVNGDGFTDLIVTDGGSNKTISVLFGNNDGTFNAPISSQVFDTLVSTAVSDLNSDGILDAVTLSSTGDFIFLRGLPEVTTSTAYTSTTRDFETIFDGQRNIRTKPGAYLMLEDLKALRDQIDTNLKAFDKGIGFLMDNINLLRFTGLSFLEVMSSNSSDPISSEDELLNRIRDSMRAAPQSALNQLENLDAMTLVAINNSGILN